MTNHQIRDEASGVFHAENTFDVNFWHLKLTGIANLLQVDLQLVRKCRLLLSSPLEGHGSYFPNSHGFRDLSALVGRTSGNHQLRYFLLDAASVKSVQHLHGSQAGQKLAMEAYHRNCKECRGFARNLGGLPWLTACRPISWCWLKAVFTPGTGLFDRSSTRS